MKIVTMVHGPQQQRHQPNHAAAESDDEGSGDENRDKVATLVEQIMALLRLTFGVSSKLVRPTLEQLLSKSIPTINYIYNHATPQRLRDWLQIVQASVHNSLQIVTQTSKGKELSEDAIQTASNAMHLLTSANSRQLLIESMGTYVKLIDALRSPETKSFLTSLPVLLCRLADTVASGEAKCLYHSSTEVILKLIETMGQPETTLALAEVTAELCHVLEMERDFYGPWSRRRRTKKLKRGRRRKIRLIGYASGDEAVKNAKRRYGRNRYIRDTYQDRTILKDRDLENDESDDACAVEDAILSSLGDGTLKDNAWFGLGNQDVKGISEDELSLPSRVVLHKTPSAGNSIQEADAISMDFDQSMDSPGKYNNNIDGNFKSIDMDYLRSSIKDREKALSERQLSTLSKEEVHPKISDPPLKNCVGSVSDMCEDASSDADIEDLVLKESNSVQDADINNSPWIGKQPKVADEMNPNRILVGDEDMNTYHDERNLMAHSTLLNSKNIELGGSSSAAVHFYRALDDVHRKIRSDRISDNRYNTTDDAKTENREQISENGSMSNQQNRTVNLSKRIRSSAIGNRRVRGHKRKAFRCTSSILDKQQSVKEEDKPVTSITSHLLSLLNLSRKQKIIIALGGIVFTFFCFLFFGFGCYGFYKFFIENKTAMYSTKKTSSFEPNEIVIRIVHDNIISDQVDTKECMIRTTEDTIINHATEALKAGVISQDYNFIDRVERSLDDINDSI
jgi:hypothetical protein